MNLQKSQKHTVILSLEEQHWHLVAAHRRSSCIQNKQQLNICKTRLQKHAIIYALKQEKSMVKKNTNNQVFFLSVLLQANW